MAFVAACWRSPQRVTPGAATAGRAARHHEWSDWNAPHGFQSTSPPTGARVFDALYAHLEAEARAAGAAALRLYVHRDNLPARRAYARVGMVENGYVVYECALTGDEEDT